MSVPEIKKIKWISWEEKGSKLEDVAIEII